MGPRCLPSANVVASSIGLPGCYLWRTSQRHGSPRCQDCAVSTLSARCVRFDIRLKGHCRANGSHCRLRKKVKHAGAGTSDRQVVDWRRRGRSKAIVADLGSVTPSLHRCNAFKAQPPASPLSDLTTAMTHASTLTLIVPAFATTEAAGKGGNESTCMPLVSTGHKSMNKTQLAPG